MIANIANNEILLDKPDFGNLRTTAQVAAELGISDRRVRALCSKGRLGRKYMIHGFSCKFSAYLITTEEIAKFKLSRRGPGRPKKGKTA